MPPLLIKVPLPPVEVSKKSVWPPTPPVPPLFAKLPLPAVELSENAVKPPWNKELPLTAPPLLINVPFPAEEVSRNHVPAGRLPSTDAPLLVNMVEVPAIALFVKTI